MTKISPSAFRTFNISKIILFYNFLFFYSFILQFIYCLQYREFLFFDRIQTQIIYLLLNFYNIWLKNYIFILFFYISWFIFDWIQRLRTRILLIAWCLLFKRWIYTFYFILLLRFLSNFRWTFRSFLRRRAFFSLFWLE